MASNRTYPNKSCGNPACQILFIPTDKRQVYCSKQCGINFNNDKKNERHEVVKHQQMLERSDQILAQLHDHSIIPKRVVHITLLNLVKVNLNIGTLTVHENFIIRWYINYGLIRLYGRNGVFLIYNREEFLALKKQFLQ